MNGHVHSYQVACPLVHFVWVPRLLIVRIVPSILQKWLFKCLFLRWDVCKCVWFREAFSFFRGTLLGFFSFISTCLMVMLPKCPSTCRFFPIILILFWFYSPFPSATSLFPTFIITISISWLYILITCIRVSISFSFFTNSVRSFS